ncbi:TPA: signal recognition particle-docking protein FtsY [candidate division WOR-3 bacterium]|jgi:fused signal recognition particle receptor|uniref:Signal recognition particle-docking protein FtsY n=1 Tax=candidate division WOR-3 bacterium TaxID=2052148 RepID=A0A350HA93_UNCW3|nr:signal recognition particle-docking protein FtsY [candidate division WOR-3 bacterium]
MLLNQIKNIFKKAKLPLNQLLESAFKGGKLEDYDFIEEQLIIADIGMETADKIIKELKRQAREGIVIGRENLLEILKKIISGILLDPIYPNEAELPLILLVSGINGAGKTTTIGKLANMYEKKGKKVLLGACDTFRAAADEQLKIWSERAKSQIYISKESKDPAAVAYETVSKGIAEGFDIIIIDTAGRMHTNDNLMKEIKKIGTVLRSKFDKPNIFSILVIDSTTGKNALNQAKEFKNVADVDAIFLSKMDGTAKGGNIITIADELKLPISYIGIGEGIDDITGFEKESFIEEII